MLGFYEELLYLPMENLGSRSFGESWWFGAGRAPEDGPAALGAAACGLSGCEMGSELWPSPRNTLLPGVPEASGEPCSGVG